MKNLRVAVVEDESFTRSLVVNALQSQGLDVVLETGSATYALKTATMMKVDAAVLDLDLGPGPSGLDLALGLRRNLPRIGIVFLTSYKDPRLVGSTATLTPIAVEYLEKHNFRDINTLREGIERSIHRITAKPAGANQPLGNLGEVNQLTGVQIEITRLVAQGKSNLEIAQIRGVTEKSVEQALSRILKKVKIDMDVRTNRRVELALYFLRQTGVVLDERR